MASNPKKDHSLSIDEMTGGVTLPNSTRPIKLTREAPKLPTTVSTADSLSAKQSDTGSVSPLPLNDHASKPELPSSVPLHDEIIANRTYKVATPSTPGVSSTQPLPESHIPAGDAPQAFVQPQPSNDPLHVDQTVSRKLPAIDLRPDNSDERGLKGPDGVTPITWISRFSQKLHLSSLFTRQRLRYLFIGLFSFGVFYMIFNYQLIVAQLSYAINQPKVPVATTQPSTTTSATIATASQAEIVPPDNIIVIPKIGVNAPVILESSQAEKNIQLALRDGVVHYAGTALPGENGNVAIVGHSSNDWWEPGNYKFVFALLDKIVPGDTIQINYSSHKYVYQVTSTKVVEPTDLSVLDPTPDPTLTLITCTPPGTSWKRLIITAKQIEPAATSTKAAAVTAAATSTPAPVQALPGNAPSLLAQIGNFLQGIINFFFHKPADTTTQPAAAQPAQHLPDLK